MLVIRMQEIFCVGEFCMTELIVIFEISRLTQPKHQVPPGGSVPAVEKHNHIIYFAMARPSGFILKDTLVHEIHPSLL
jgi:hypothetical protein